MPSLTPAPGMQQDNNRKFRKSTIDRRNSRNCRNKAKSELKAVSTMKAVPTIVRKTKTKSKLTKMKKKSKVLVKQTPKLQIEDIPVIEEHIPIAIPEEESIRKRRKTTVGRRKYCKTNKKKLIPENAPRTKRKYVKSLKYSKKTKALLYEITQSMKNETECEQFKMLEPSEVVENINVIVQSDTKLEILQEPSINQKWPRIKHSYTNYFQVYNIGFAETTKGIVYKCFSKSCKFQTYDQCIFKNHLISFHDDVPSTSETFCAFCNEVFSSSSLLHELEHINEKHLEFASNTTNETSDSIQDIVELPLVAENSIEDIVELPPVAENSLEVNMELLPVAENVIEMNMVKLQVAENIIEINMEILPVANNSLEVNMELLPVADNSIEVNMDLLSEKSLIQEHQTILEELEPLLIEHQKMFETLQPILIEHEPKSTIVSPNLTQVVQKKTNLKSTNKKVYLERRSDDEISRSKKPKTKPTEPKLNISKMMQDFSDISSDEDSIFNDSLELKASIFDFNDISSDESVKSFKSMSSSTNRINKIFNNPDFCVQRILHDSKKNLSFDGSNMKKLKQTEKPKLIKTSQVPTQVPVPPTPPIQSSVQTQIQVTVQAPVVMNKLNLRTLQPWIDKRPNFKYEISCNKMLEKNSLFATYKCMGFTCSYFTSSEHMFYGHLKLHQQNHLCDYPDTYLFCSYCSQTFEKIKDLMNHIKEVHQHDKYQCSHCFYRSCEVQSCSVHMDVYHSKQETKTVLECEIENVAIDIDGLFEKLIENRLKYVAPLRCKGSFQCLNTVNFIKFLLFFYFL